MTQTKMTQTPIRKINVRLWGLLTIVATSTSMTSCNEDAPYNTPHPDRGAVIITADWSDTIPETDSPTSYLISIDGDAAKQADATRFLYPELLTPGSHNLLAYNEPQGITLDGEMAQVNRLEDGTIEPMPGYLFSAMQEIDVPQDDTLHVSLPMARRVSPININISLSGENVSKIATIEATLSGLAGSVDLRSGKVGSGNAATRPEFGRYGDNSRAKKYGFALKCRVLGIDTTMRQILILTFTLNDGYVSTVTLDLTESLANLNTEMNPVVISGAVEMPQDGHFSGTIDNWDIASGSATDAH